MQVIFRGLVIALTGLLAVGCASVTSPSPPAGSPAPLPQMLGVVPGPYLGIAWVDPTHLVMGYGPDPAKPAALDQLWGVKTDSSSFGPLSLGSDGCVGNDDDPHSMADGEFAFERQCLQRGPTFLYDGRFGAPDLRELARLDIAPFSLHGASWAPDLSRAVASAGNRICEGFVWISGNVMTPMTETIYAGGVTYPLGAGVTTDDCDSTVVAGGATWSPTGQQVALWAASPKAGVSSFARLDLPMALYLVDPKTGTTTPEPITAGSPSQVSWSPDGRWLAFTEFSPQSGLWLVDTSRWTPRFVASGKWEDQSWSPDGRSLAMLLGVGPLGSATSQPAIVSVGPIVDGR